MNQSTSNSKRLWLCNKCEFQTPDKKIAGQHVAGTLHIMGRGYKPQ